MQFSTIFLSLVSLAMAAPVKVNLQVEPVEGCSNFDGKYLAAFHEGAGMNYFFAVDSPEAAAAAMGSGNSFYQETSDNSIYQKVVTGDGAINYNFTMFGSILGDEPVPASDKFTVVDGYLALNGSTTPGWYGEYNIQEPYEYGKTHPAMVLYTHDAPVGSSELKIKVVNN